MSSIISLSCLLVFVGVILSWASSVQAQLIGGTESEQGRWPFFAGLFYKPSKWFFANAPHCGAVVWDKDTLLTAAHCVMKNPNHPELFDVYMGYNSWTKWKLRDAKYVFKVKEIIMHPHFDFKKSHLLYDIALIFLDRSIDFKGSNRKVQRVNHPEPLDYLDTLMCVTMGWGRDIADKKPTKLMEAVLPILDNRICKKHCYYFNPNHHLCAGYVSTAVPTSINNGDSGGPLVCPQKANPHKYSLVGIVSYSVNGPYILRKPSYFTNVKLFEDWIASVRPKARNVKPPAEMSYWAGFKKRWLGRLFCYRKLVK